MSDRILIIGELGDDVQLYADALAQDAALSMAPTVLDAGNHWRHRLAQFLGQGIN